MTPQQHAHAQALNEAHIFFGGHDTFPGVWRLKRERWIAAREIELVKQAAAAETPVRSTT